MNPQANKEMEMKRRIQMKPNKQDVILGLKKFIETLRPNKSAIAYANNLKKRGINASGNLKIWLKEHKGYKW